MDLRKEKGIIIAKNSRIRETEKGWEVPSQSGHGYYTVEANGHGSTCDCPDYELRKDKCKHIWAVEFVVTKTVEGVGDLTLIKTVKKSYKQDWKNYNLAQQREKPLFMNLLADLTSMITQQPKYGPGRPSIPISDMLYSMIFKVYSTFSGRRFTGDMRIALEKGYLSEQPHYNSIFHYFQKEELTPVLAKLVTTTSLPLKTVENYFAVDATGFGTSNFQRWHSFKYGRDMDRRKWVKCHFVTGVQTNIISSVKITSQFENDSPHLKELVNKTAEFFDMEAITGDMAYSSRDNLELISSHGATPYIPFRSNATGTKRGSSVWRKMFHYFQYKHEEFLDYYHTRSNAESTVHMIKSKFGNHVRSKKWTSQVNEVLCKAICHNICVVIQEMHELGITPDFYTTTNL